MILLNPLFEDQKEVFVELDKEENLDISIIQNVDVAILDDNGKGDKLITSIYF